MIPAANQLWINQGNGAFRDQALESGVAYSADGLAKAGMGVTLADVENDGGRSPARHKSDARRRHCVQRRQERPV